MAEGVPLLVEQLALTGFVLEVLLKLFDCRGCYAKRSLHFGYHLMWFQVVPLKQHQMQLLYRDPEIIIPLPGLSSLHHIALLYQSLFQGGHRFSKGSVRFV